MISMARNTVFNYKNEKKNVFFQAVNVLLEIVYGAYSLLIILLVTFILPRIYTVRPRLCSRIYFLLIFLYLFLILVIFSGLFSGNFLINIVHYILSTNNVAGNIMNKVNRSSDFFFWWTESESDFLFWWFILLLRAFL